MNLLYQRYLLSAQTGAINVLASSTQNSGVASAIVPVSGNWNIRLKGIGIQVSASDNSGQLQLLTLALQWLMLGPGNVQVFNIEITDGLITPAYALPAAASGAFTMRGAPYNQVVSSFDQVGSVTTGIQAQGLTVVKNADAAAAHAYTLILNAICEYDDPGST